MKKTLIAAVMAITAFAAVARENITIYYSWGAADTAANTANWRSMMLELQQRGAITFDYGNNLRGQAHDKRGVKNAFNFPGFVPEYIRPLFCEGKGPFRWVALSGDPEDIYTTDKALMELFPETLQCLL